ncbi:acyl-CoA desaturase [Leptospira bandrabouensis]|uniref:acyl-CoA desaturase n=1 Tax=Leptospira bandrabouensis TaxID=2484903 RepID=UPI001EEA89C8|nr:acyl-CoA desaturase [Leptospira bandrabouensis]MCG6151180.1 acyl-CoA desaturase [Leptospira bandrabouensis]MCW7457294.1 acyl-CoA desaturase [Leptospira bandrabouensis]MCW7476432.1 acyl-CoA desaturase [Leptospira bandrabouensis]MCW7484115.1 acyl-CoA desaturase [Leptospira bandrabouensis]
MNSSSTVEPVVKEQAPLLFLILFFLVQATVLTVFTVPFSWSLVWLAVGSYFLRMFGITAAYHRYFSHASFKTSRVFQFILAWIGAMSMQKGPLWWAAHHRNHHKYSDTEKDIHSPSRKGFWYSHMLWFLRNDYNDYEAKLIPDFYKYPELRFLDRNHWIPPLSYAILLYLVGGWAWLVYGYAVSTFFLGHATWTINSLSHVFGSVRYDSRDTSKNNLWLALLTMGEGWHNNHHYYCSSVNQGFYWYEVDVSYYILKVLSWFGIVWDLKKPPKKVIEEGLLRDREQKATKRFIKESKQPSKFKNKTEVLSI